MTALDLALDMLAGTGPEYSGGLASHGPMAAEALCALGREDAVVPWVEKYRRRLGDRPQPRKPIESDAWREALGDYARVGDWIEVFSRELAANPWKAVLGEWVPRLAPGLAAAATHGIIRTAHATRGLSALETDGRRRELAEGLAYWAARYQELGASPAHTPNGLRPSEAIARVPILPPERRGQGLISDRLLELTQLPSFPQVAGLVDTSGDASRFISDLTETFARIYLAHARPSTLIILIHALTGPSALRLLVPHLGGEAAGSLLRYGWQVAAAMYAASAQVSPPPVVVAAPVEDKPGLVDRAIATGDEHAIKFTEACLREYEHNAAPVYLLAARRAVDHLGGGAGD